MGKSGVPRERHGECTYVDCDRPCLYPAITDSHAGTEKICVSELDAIVKSVDLQHDTEGCFFEEITNKSSHVQPPGRNQDPYGSNPLASLGTLPDSVESAVQNEALHTWSLLTELAGPQGLYCDRVTHAMTALLIDSRRA